MRKKGGVYSREAFYRGRAFNRSNTGIFDILMLFAFLNERDPQRHNIADLINETVGHENKWLKRIS